MDRLIFTPGKDNGKLAKLEKVTGKTVYAFSLLSGGEFCPYAKECQATVKVDPITGERKLVDGPHMIFRCFSASQERQYPNVYDARNKNTWIVAKAAESPQTAAQCLSDALPQDAELVRIHVAGDFATKNYFRAWLKVARDNPHIVFYAYTKSLPFWVALRDEIPENFRLTASRGGYRDDLIETYNLPSAIVVHDEAEATSLGLEVDSTDAIACEGNRSFALVIHSPQKAGTSWSKAVSAQRKIKAAENKAKKLAMQTA